MKITKANKEEIEEFNNRTWEEADIEHYGKEIKWVFKKFIFKAVENKIIIGTIQGNVKIGVLYIDDLVVNQNYRNKGVGKQLMNKAEIFGKKLNAHKIFLITGKNWGAAKFYESLGFKKEADLPKHYLKDDFVAYSKFV